MDHDGFEDFGVLALGSRLRRLSDRLMQQGTEVYRASGVAFEPKWFPLFNVLLQHSPATVTQAAEMLGLTHAAVSQFAKDLSKRGLVRLGKDARDERKTTMIVSAKGHAMAEQLRPLWKDIRHVASGLVKESGMDVLQAVQSVERSLANETLLERIRRVRLAAVQLVTYEDRYAEDFARLNREWLTKYFHVEQIDEEVFADPHKHILAAGGEIFFALLDGEVVGTCAMINDGEGSYELAKLAVTEKAQGLRLGYRLFNECLDWGRRMGAKKVHLVTNSKLLPAVSLYERAGFVVTYRGPHPKYMRGNLHMEKVL